MRRLVTQFLVFSFFVSSAHAIDSYDVMEALLDHSQHPRLLNTIDIPDLMTTDPEPLFTLEGDFNHDGKQDKVITGVFDLATNTEKYFILIATQLDRAHHFSKIFYAAFPHPVFIHERGTTGEGDPGNEEFSISFCWNCSKGEDFYWDDVRHQFDRKPWTSRVQKSEKLVSIPSENVSSEIVDKALRIVGSIKDVQIFIAGLKKSKSKLVTHVDKKKNDPTNQLYVVTLLGKKKEKEKTYEKFLVNVETNQVVKRKYTIK